MSRRDDEGGGGDWTGRRRLQASATAEAQVRQLTALRDLIAGRMALLQGIAAATAQLARLNEDAAGGRVSDGVGSGSLLGRLVAGGGSFAGSPGMQLGLVVPSGGGDGGGFRPRGAIVVGPGATIRFVVENMEEMMLMHAIQLSLQDVPPAVPPIAAEDAAALRTMSVRAALPLLQRLQHATSGVAKPLGSAGPSPNIAPSDGDEPACTICISTLEPSEDCVLLPCGHLFCPPCIREWLGRQRSCPVCRREVVGAAAMYAAALPRGDTTDGEPRQQQRRLHTPPRAVGVLSRPPLPHHRASGDGERQAAERTSASEWRPRASAVVTLSSDEDNSSGDDDDDQGRPIRTSAHRNNTPPSSYRSEPPAYPGGWRSTRPADEVVPRNPLPHASAASPPFARPRLPESQRATPSGMTAAEADAVRAATNAVDRLRDTVARSREQLFASSGGIASGVAPPAVATAAPPQTTTPAAYRRPANAVALRPTRTPPAVDGSGALASGAPLRPPGAAGHVSVAQDATGARRGGAPTTVPPPPLGSSTGNPRGSSLAGVPLPSVSPAPVPPPRAGRAPIVGRLRRSSNEERNGSVTAATSALRTAAPAAGAHGVLRGSANEGGRVSLRPRPV